MKFKLKPGDLIDWEYNADNFRVINGDRLWSSIDQVWIRIDSICLVVSVIDELLVMLSNDELISLTFNDFLCNKTYDSDEYAAPRLVMRGRNCTQGVIS